MLNKEWKGSITVEAVFVVPIIIVVLISLIYMSFYMHDVCVIKSISDEILWDLTHVKESGLGAHRSKEDKQEYDTLFWLSWSETDEKAIEHIVESSISQKLFLFSYESCVINANFKSIESKIIARKNNRLPFIQVFIPSIQVTITSYSALHQPVMNVRVGKELYAFIEDNPTVEAIKKIIVKLKPYIS